MKRGGRREFPWRIMHQAEKLSCLLVCLQVGECQQRGASPKWRKGLLGKAMSSPRLNSNGLGLSLSNVKVWGRIIGTFFPMTLRCRPSVHFRDATSG
jgi:hypothetical protein